MLVLTKTNLIHVRTFVIHVFIYFRIISVSWQKRCWSREFLKKNKIRPLLDFIKLYINFDEQLNIEFDKSLESLTIKNKRNMGIREQILDITKKRGVELGLKEGERLGLQKGEAKAKTTIAKKMKLEGVSQALIAKFTGLSIRQIRML